MTAFVKTQDGVPSCVNPTYIGVNFIQRHQLLLFDDATDVVNEENPKAGTALII
jgi:hypothetical protein